MREKFNRFLRTFMIGRYGADQFARFTMSVAMVSIILSIFIRNGLLDLIGMIAIFYTYFRMFSRNIQKRYQENQKFLNATSGIRSRFQKEKSILQQKKTHHIYKCPGCGQKIRIPRSGGKKVEISCPKCQTKFVKKI